MNGDLRGKRRDPWHRPTHRQKRWPTCARWPGCERFTYSSRPGSQVSGRNHWLKRANKPHPIIHAPKGLGRPCYEADNSASHGEWRRGATDLHRRCQMVAAGKSVWRAPTPQFVPVGLRSDRDFLFSLQLIPNILAPASLPWSIFRRSLFYHGQNS